MWKRLDLFFILFLCSLTVGRENREMQEKSRKIRKLKKIPENHEFPSTLTQFDAIWSLFHGTLILTHPHSTVRVSAVYRVFLHEGRVLRRK
jgi:hypothetical protein